MAVSKTEKEITLMKSSHGTICLISQAGVSDYLLNLSKKRKNGEKIYSKQPIDSWSI
jgi:hypothetical protein